jgi:hypothetical protein
VWRLDGALEGTIEITAVQPHNPMPHPVVVHRTLRWDPIDRKIHRNVPVTSVNRTLVDYGAVVPRILVERAVEDAFRRGLTNEGALRRRLAQIGGPGCRGAGQLRWVLDHRFEGKPARSGFEVIVGSILREYDIVLPERRVLVGVPPDQKFELDLAYVDRKVDIEAMGEKWHSTTRQRRADAERRRVLSSVGWSIVEVWWDQAMHEPWDVAARVRSARG